MFDILVCNDSIIVHQGLTYEIDEHNVHVRNDEGKLVFIIGCLNNGCCRSEQIDDLLDDFETGKYLYKDGVVSIRPGYIATVEHIERLEDYI